MSEMIVKEGKILALHSRYAAQAFAKKGCDSSYSTLILSSGSFFSSLSIKSTASFDIVGGYVIFYD
jgi:hypothetical protein